MIETWYALVSFMLMMFVVLDGLDMGAGMLQHLVGKTDAERRMVVAAIGPLWSWHEVWLVSFGGTLFVAFPNILAVSFSGFYFALFLLLWALIGRGISIEVGGRIQDPLWRTAWDFAFVASNVLLAILIGAALGNVVRGVPLKADGKFTMALFTNFSPYGNVGILDWYTVSVAVFTLATFAAHGANALVLKTEGLLHDRSLRIAGILCGRCGRNYFPE
jgi:cytochrome d ubiquinol oxidase subunit II